MRSSLGFLPADERNLAAAAALRLCAETAADCGGLSIELDKSIPVCAGLAGGSADAAAVLRGLNRLLGLGLPPERLEAIGARVGSDVPYCVRGGTALAEGRGEVLTTLPALPDCHVVLCKPAFSVPTPAPATPTPPPEPTPDPTFSPATVPPITDPSVGSVPKTIQSILLPVLILAGILLIASCVLLLIATKRTADQRKASKSAIDQLERAKRRDYVTPAEEEEPEQTEETTDEVTVESKALDEDAEEDLELPHLKYARSASRPAPVEDEEDYSAIRGGLYDADLATTAAAQETDAKTEEAPGVAQKAQRKEEPQPEEKA